MKTQLFLKFFAGPKKSLLIAAHENATCNVAEVVDHIVGSIHSAGIAADRPTLRLLLRRFGRDCIWADGHFDNGSGTYGYFMYGPERAQLAEIDAFLYHSLNPRLFYQAHIERNADCLFSGHGMPSDPELPLPQTMVWTELDGVVDITGGHRQWSGGRN